MFRFHILGLSICIHGRNSLDVLMLNSNSSDQILTLPYHLPSLFASRSFVRSYTQSRLPSVVRRFEDEYRDSRTLGWSLMGLTGNLPGSTPPEMVLAPLENPEGPLLPNQDWSSLNWVLSADAMFPKTRPAEEFRALGPKVNAIIRFRGGRVEGGHPLSEGYKRVYQAKPGYEQMFTDVMDVVYDGLDPVIEFVDTDNRTSGAIAFERRGEAWLVNEAPERVRRMKLLEPPPAGPAVAGAKKVCVEDARLYAEAFGQPKESVNITVKKELSNEIFDTDYCTMIRYVE